MSRLDLNVTFFPEIYYRILKHVNSKGVLSLNKRTKTEVRTYKGTLFFSVDLSDGLLPVPANRRYFPRVAAAETAWQVLGTKDPSFIMKHAPKLWENFIEKGVVETAYGARWTKHFGRDQLSMALDALRRDHTNRQVYVSAWDPAIDGLGGPDQPKNIPCPLGFTLNVIDEEVHMSVHMRSSDLVVGLPYDVMSYSLMLDAISASIKRSPGTLSFTLANAHIYSPHFELVEESLSKNKHAKNPVHLPGWNLNSIFSNPEGYVEQVDILASRSDVHPFSPKAVVVL